MAMVVLLVDGHDGVTVGPDAAATLARLGVTNVTVVRDQTFTALVVEGWLFDLASAPEAAAAVIGPDQAVRVLGPLIQLAISARIEGGTDVSEATNRPGHGVGRSVDAQSRRLRAGASPQGRPHRPGDR